MEKLSVIPSERIVNKIYDIRNQKVMLDRDLAELYGVTTGNLNLAVRRNIQRFPGDFMFQMSKEELENWILQFATSNSVKMGLRKRPYVFTEQGVAMLSSVLKSKRAIQTNIQIIRTFTNMRKLLLSHDSLHRKLMELEKRHGTHDEKIVEIINALNHLLQEEKKPKRRIGFTK